MKNQKVYDSLTKILQEQKYDNISNDDFFAILKEEGIIHDDIDGRILVLEVISNLLFEEEEFPIKFLFGNESLPEDQKVVSGLGEMLTDDYIRRMKG